MLKDLKIRMVMNMNNICPDYDDGINCYVNRGLSSKDTCAACKYYDACNDCYNFNNCPHDHAYNQYNFLNFNGPIETQQD